MLGSIPHVVVLFLLHFLYTKIQSKYACAARALTNERFGAARTSSRCALSHCIASCASVRYSLVRTVRSVTVVGTLNKLSIRAMAPFCYFFQW